MFVDSEQRIRADELKSFVADLFVRCGMATKDADVVADSLVVADLSGVHSHGVLRVPEYVKKMTTNGVNPTGRPRMTREFGGCMVVDGNNSMGQIGARFAMRQAIKRAELHGIAAAAVRGSNHCGAMGYYAEMALESGMIGIATTNALPTMAPVGGVDRIIGINPLAFAIPSGDEPPIVFDAAFSGSAHGKIRVYQQKGLEIPAGWAIDSEGKPTTDPAAALEGLLLPSGGYKGAAMAMIMGIISSMLSGAAYGTELGDMERGPTAGLDGHFFAAIKIEAFEDPARFKSRVDGAIRQVHASRLAPGADRVYTPGEKEFLNRQSYRRDGIPLNATTLADLDAVADELGVVGRTHLLRA